MSDWVPDEEVSHLIRKFALQNALEYDGKGQAGSVQGRVLGENTELREQAQFLYAIITPMVEEANNIWAEKGADEVRRILEEEAPEALEKRVKERREGLPELPNAVEGQVVLRFAPNPNGPLTLGHSRGVIINTEYARMYSGKIILRFDDTDTKIKRPDEHAYDWIQDDFTWLAGCKPDIVIEASARMDVYLEFAQQFISEGHMYVCTCTAEDFRGFRVSMQDCPCRDNSNSDNLAKWKEMNDTGGGFSEGDAVVRVRTSMDNNNPALRDWPALRIQTAPHPKVGNKYRVWPLLDFQSAVEDHEQGVTHIIRGKDLMDSTRKQQLLYDKIGWSYPETLYWGRVKVHEFGGFSTSQMKIDIAEGQFTGWDDPGLPTVKAMRRRGFCTEAMKRFWLDFSLTQKDISVPLATLESLNAKVIDKDAPRLSFIQEPVKLALSCEGEKLPEVLNIPRHPLHEELGMREWPLDNACGLEVFIEKEDYDAALSNNGSLRLKDFADIEIDDSKEGRIIGMNRSDERPIVHWLAAGMERPFSLHRPSEYGEWALVEGLIEDNLHQVGMVVQLERIGFSRIESDEVMIWTHS